MNTQYFYEINNGKTGYIDANSIESAREIFKTLFPDVAPECAGIWTPSDPEYPENTDL